MYNCAPDTLNNKALVSHILNTLPEELGMKKLIDPVVMFAQPNGSKDPGGWSGFVMIQESHISIHTFIKRRFVSVDVYSCRQFDTQAGITYFKNAFKTEDIESTVEVRGKKYPAAEID
jgi:S-adenosylmethionine decarboxylase